MISLRRDCSLLTRQRLHAARAGRDRLGEHGGGGGTLLLVEGEGHRVRVGMRTSMVGLAVWSFMMASAHGAGLMLVPALLPLERGTSNHVHAAGHVMPGSLGVAVAAVGVHTLAMLGMTGIVAVVVYEWVGVGVLRRGWINLDLIWTIALVATGVILFATAGH